MLRSVALFANHTKTGSIYNSPWVQIGGCNRAFLYVNIGNNPSAGESYTVNFHYSPDGAIFDNYPHLVQLADGSLNTASWRKCPIAAGTTKTLYVFDIPDAPVINYVRAIAEVNGITGSAAVQGTLSVTLLVDEKSSLG